MTRSCRENAINLVIPLNSNRFSGRKSTCHVSLVKLTNIQEKQFSHVIRSCSFKPRKICGSRREANSILQVFFCFWVGRRNRTLILTSHQSKNDLCLCQSHCSTELKWAQIPVPINKSITRALQPIYRDKFDLNKKEEAGRCLVWKIAREDTQNRKQKTGIIYLLSTGPYRAGLVSFP